MITNGVIHSKSEVFALMFSDRFNTKFSISDNGIGLIQSMIRKEENFFYTPYSLKIEMETKKVFEDLNKNLKENLLIIFETLFYSSLKDREGLFDLLVKVVLQSKGYFRIHTENCQVIISNRMMDELLELGDLRSLIIKLHSSFQLGQLLDHEYKMKLAEQASRMKQRFINFYLKTVEKFSSDAKYSSIRFYKVRFRGVHIEVEIPNA